MFTLRPVLVTWLVLAFAPVALAHAQGEIVPWGWNSGMPGSIPNAGFISVSASGWRGPGIGVPYIWRCAAVRENGTLVVWDGQNSEYGYWAPPDTDIVAVSVQVSGLNTLILRRDGSIWTANPPPGPNSGFVAVSSSPDHCLALRDDGSIVAWGDNTNGECDVPEPNEGYVAIAASGEIIGTAGYSLAIKSDGAIVGWGFNGYGQLEVPEPNSDFVSVAAGGGYAAGIKADGSAVLWGQCAGGCDPPIPNSDFVGVAISNPTGGRRALLRHDGSMEGGEAPEPNVGYVAVALSSEHALAIRGRPSASVQLSPTIASAAISVFPNPFSMRTAVTGPAKDVTVYAATGRLVRGLGQTTEWDGLDMHGQRVSPGVYFLRLTSPQGPRSLRVIRLP